MATTTKNSAVNSTTNSNTSSTVKSDNGFCILASLINSSADSYITNYQALSFDSVSEITFSRTANVTSYSIEDGSEVSDNVTIGNSRFTLKGVISESPIRTVKDMIYTGGSGSNSGNRISLMINYLNQVIEARKPITLITEHKVFTNIILTGISYGYSAQEAMIFDLTFEQVKLVKTATVNDIAVKTQTTKSIGGTVKTPVKGTGSTTSSNLNARITAAAASK